MEVRNPFSWGVYSDSLPTDGEGVSLGHAGISQGWL